MAYDFQKVKEAGYTGLNSKSGDLIIIKVRPASGTSTMTKIADLMYITLVNNQILEVCDVGISVFD